MSAQTYVINRTSPIPIYPSGQSEAVTVMNNETTRTVLLADIPGNNGFPLSPGSSMTWDAGKSLYAWVQDASLPVTLVILDNGGSITNAGAIAQQIIANGLADQIAASIVGSPLAGNIGKAAPVPPSAAAIGAAVPAPPTATAIGSAVGSSALPTNTANAIYAQGIPAVDKPVILWAGDAFTGNTFYDISRFQSLHIRVDGLSFSSLSTLVLVNVSTITTAPAPLGQVTMQDEYFSMYGNSSMQIVMPAIGDKVVVNVMVNQVGVTVNQANVTLLGSYRPVQETSADIDSIRWGSNSNGTSLQFSGDNTTRTVGISGQQVPVSASLTEYPPFRPGPATLTVRITNAATAGWALVGLFDVNTGWYIGGKRIDATDGNGIWSFPITIPNTPIRMGISTNGAWAPVTNNIYLTITYN